MEKTSKKKQQTQLQGESKESLINVFHVTENYLSNQYDFRYNTIAKEIESRDKKKQEPWAPFNEHNLYIELRKAGITISLPNLISILKSNYTPHYNPIAEYFSNLPKWSETHPDYINILCNYIHCVDQDVFRDQFKKWLVRTVRCALDDEFFNKQALVFVQSGQNTGKSTFCRWLCPPALSAYIAEDISVDKDSRILLTKNFIINLDELSSLHKKEINALKSMFSKSKVNDRLPYDKKNSILSRVCSFVGSTNLSEFLNDETGSVRWLCFELIKLNWAYKNECNIDAIWAQAYSLYKNNYSANMSPEDIRVNEHRNKRFQLMSLEQELILSMYRKPYDKFDGGFQTATDITQSLTAHTTHRINKTMVGRAMVALGYPRVKDKKTDRYGYHCVFIEQSTVFQYDNTELNPN